MKYRDLKKHLNTEELHLAYYATGDDDYLISAVRRLFKEKITVMPEINVSRLASGADGREVVEACEMLPLMSDKRLVIVEDYNKNTAELEQYLKNPNPVTVLLLIRPTVKEWSAALTSKLTQIDCNKLDITDILKFLAAKSVRKSCAITDEAARLLIEYCVSDMSRIDSESDKLFDFKMNDTVVAADVQSMVTPDLEFKIYELSEAVSIKNGNKAALILKSLYDSKEEPSAVLSALYAHFRRMLYCSINSSSPELAALLGVKEYAVTKTRAQAVRYSPLRLKKICDGFHEFDFAFKSGEIPAALASELQVMRILSES